MRCLKIINCDHPDFIDVMATSKVIDVYSCSYYSNCWYLHGDLEKMIGYDQGGIYNLHEFPEFQKDTLIFYGAGIIDGNTSRIIVQDFKDGCSSYINAILPVRMYEINEECVGYFWTTNEKLKLAIKESTGERKKFLYWHQRGLVCLKNDKEANRYALECYNDRTTTL